MTLSYDPGVEDLSTIEPYQGALDFGPELFETIDDGWHDKFTTKSFAEATGDIVDQATDELLADEGWHRVMDPLANPLLAAARGAASFDDAKARLAGVVDLMDADQLTEALARAGFAVDMAALGGVDG